MLKDSSLKRVLIISYYWPPSGGAGVQRWLKFVKYLRDFGWEPIIYKPKNPEYPVLDESLQKDVPDNLEIIERDIWEPYQLYKKFIGQKKDEKINASFLTEQGKPKRTEKISVWLRGNFFIPDARRYWIKPSVKHLSAYIKEHPIDAMVSTGPPHSMHLIALGLKKKFNIPWLADFRDPWTNIDFYQDLMLTKPADRKHRRQERTVLETADCVVSIGPTMTEEMKALGAKNAITITNGYDHEDLPEKDIQLSKKFNFSHIGSLVKTRNSPTLWKVLQSLCQEIDGFKDDLEITLVGKVDIAVTESLQEANLSDCVNKIAYVPHAEVMNYQRSSQVLLLLANDTPNGKGILTGKFFEYMSAQRPILAIGHTSGDLAEIVQKTQCGNIFDFKDTEGIKTEIKRLYGLFKLDQLTVNSTDTEEYSRRSLTKKLSSTLNSLLES